MRKRRGLLSAWLVALGMTALAMSGAPAALAAEAAADAADRLFARENDLTAQLRALSQAMGKELAQVAAGSNPDEALEDLGVYRQRFAELLRALHQQDQAPQSRSSSNPAIGQHLAVADTAWPELDRMIGDAVSWKHLTHYEVLQFDAAARQLDLVLTDLQNAYRGTAVDLGVHSVILKAIAVAEEQRVLSQEIPKTFILMLYGVDASQNRERLAAAIEEFDRDMSGLVDGSPERGLAPAPTPGIRADLLAAQSTWRLLRESLTLESSGAALDAEAIATVSELSDSLYEHLDAAIDGLKAL